jgi:hypothetical protein
MAQPKIELKLDPVLRTYLDRKQRDYEMQPEAHRAPTLPSTKEGKVNVKAVAREMLETPEGRDLSPNIWQHFHNKDSLRALINVVAENQGLGRIRCQAEEDQDDDAAKAEIGRARAEAKRQTEGHLQERVRVAQLERENADLRAEIESFRARLEHTRATGMLVRTGAIVDPGDVG